MIKVEMNGPAGRIVVAQAEVPVKLRLGYRFATPADEARYQSATKPPAASSQMAGIAGNVTADGGPAAGPDSPALAAADIDPAKAQLDEFEDLEDLEDEEA